MELAEINREAEVLLAAADDARTRREYRDAIREYLQILEEFGASRYVPDAAEGLLLAVAALDGQYTADLESLADEILVLQADLVALQEELVLAEEQLLVARAAAAGETSELLELRRQVARLETTGAASQAEAAQLRNEIAQREAQLQTARQARDQLEAQITARETTLRQTEEELLQALEELAIAQARGGTALDPATVAELERLRDLEGDLNAAGAAWDGYRREASSLTAHADQGQVMTARVSLERFFNDASMRRFFPGLAQEIDRFDAAFLASGRENALLDTADLLVELSFSDSTDERQAILRAARRGADPALTELLTELEELLR